MGGYAYIISQRVKNEKTIDYRSGEKLTKEETELVRRLLRKLIENNVYIEDMWNPSNVVIGRINNGPLQAYYVDAGEVKFDRQVGGQVLMHQMYRRPMIASMWEKVISDFDLVMKLFGIEPIVKLSEGGISALHAGTISDIVTLLAKSSLPFIDTIIESFGLEISKEELSKSLAEGSVDAITELGFGMDKIELIRRKLW